MEKEANWKYIVYCTTNTENQKIYIGVHKTPNPEVFDGYIGCGVIATLPNTYSKPKTAFQYAVKKYGPKAFNRVTLAIFNTEREASALEAELVTEEFIARPDVYNMVLGGLNDIGKSERITIHKYNLKGEYLSTYNSFASAAVDVGCDYTSISFAVKHKNSCFGFLWSKDKVDKLNLDLYRFGDPQAKKVSIYSNGKFVKEFKTLTKAAKELNCTISALNHACLFGVNIGTTLYQACYIKCDTFDIARKKYLDSIPVYLYNSDGAFNKKFNSISEVIKLTKETDIYKALKYKKLCKDGYYYSFEQLSKFIYVPTNKKKKVGKYDLNGNLVEVYNSITQAANNNSLAVWTILKKGSGTVFNHTYKFLSD